MTARLHTSHAHDGILPRTPGRLLVSLVLGIVLNGVIVAGAPASPRPDEAGAAAQAPGARYPVSGFATTISLPLQLDLANYQIELGRTAAGYTAPRDGAEPVTGALSSLAHDPPVMYDADALRAILEQVRDRVNADLERESAEYPCVQVSFAPDEIDPATGRDLRAPGEAILTLEIIIDGPKYFVGQFVPSYRYDRLAGLPPVSDLMLVPVELAEVNGAYAVPRAGVPTVRQTLAEWSSGRAKSYHASAIVAICRAIVEDMNRRNIVAVYVAPAPEEISFGDMVLADQRRGTTDLTLSILTAVVREIRTVASGDRVKPGEPRVDNRLHERIRAGSPVQPAPAGDDDPTSGLLRKDELDNYVFRLNRHPGRRVDMALSAAEGVGGVILDYLVAENKPLFVYAQVSNTGTKETDSVRERFGLVHTQLTNNDDVFSFDYITSNFDESNAVIGSYEAPFFKSWPKWRWRINGMWSDYTASDVGLSGEEFEGESSGAGGELIYNFYQDRELFLDLTAGARWSKVDVTNSSFGFPITGDQDFFLPHVGLRLERMTQLDSLLASVQLEWNMSNVTDVDQAELNNLGRLAPDDDWIVLRWDATYSTFLEPILNPRAWADISTPESSTLAHELAFAFRGQWAVNDDRLIPQEEQVVGGLYSVRGYPESVVAADTVVLGSVEYRYHVPRAFALQETPGRLFGRDFRWAPQYVYGRPDWDLVLKGFFDIARTNISDPFSFEKDETLMGAGVGLDLQYRQNFNVRLDWGFTLESLDTVNVDSGGNRLHVVATIIF